MPRNSGDTLLRSLHVHNETSSLRTKGKLRPAITPLTFNPLLDKQGPLRVGSRIRLADLPYMKRHSIMLPGNHIDL